MDSSYEIDRVALATAIAERDHLIFRFATISLRLFVDFRVSDVDGPAVFVLPPAGSVKERMASIREVRPALPRPERLNVVAWPLRVGGLERLGIVEEVRRRLAGLDAFEALSRLDDALGELRAMEADEERRAISGDGYETLWASSVR